jgi:hypothetical protein
MPEPRRVKVNTPGDSKSANRYLRRVRSRYRAAMEEALLVYEDDTIDAYEALDKIAGILGHALQEPVAVAFANNHQNEEA